MKPGVKQANRSDNNSHSRIRGIFSLGVFFFLLVACAGPQVAKEEEKSALRSRISEYWAYRIKGDVEKAYQCELPLFREQFSILYYVNRFKLIRYLEADIQDVEIRGKEATSSVKLTYNALLKGFTRKSLTKVEEGKWVKIKGTWYHVPEDFEMKKNDPKGGA